MDEIRLRRPLRGPIQGYNGRSMAPSTRTPHPMTERSLLRSKSNSSSCRVLAALFALGLSAGVACGQGGSNQGTSTPTGVSGPAGGMGGTDGAGGMGGAGGEHFVPADIPDFLNIL